jgi:membrane protease YdiL (CAAX protease family)
MRTKFAYVGRGVLNLAVVLAVVFGLQALIRGRVSDTLGLIALSSALVVSYVAGVRWIERRQASELLAAAGFTEFAAGLALGLALFTTLMLLLWMFGVYRPSGWGSVAPLAGGLLLALLAAILEEIVFRGFLFRLSAKLLGTWGALALTSALFGAAHSFNPGATVGSSVAIALEAGVLLGAAYALTQRLWLPIGLHLGWNFAEGSIFGMSVSGGKTKASLITGPLRGRDLLTGGAFGPEASIVAVAICLAAALFLLSRTVRLGRLEPPAWAGIASVQHPPA